MLIHTLSTGDEVHRYDYALVIPFKEKRRVLSTSLNCGGYREDLDYVYNYDAHPGLGVMHKLRGATIEEHVSELIRGLGLPVDKTAGLETAASMEKVAIHTESFENVTVTALVTGGIETNGGRVGDTASWHERNGEPTPAPPGTINIILVIDADVVPGGLARALVTCTEAKTAAIQELVCRSHCSRGLATGSGTDGTVVIANPRSPARIRYTGKHSKTGELIGTAVKAAVKDALKLQTGLSPERQNRVTRRLDRFGFDSRTVYDKYLALSNADALDRPWFAHHWSVLERREDVVSLTACLAHLIDEMDWGLHRPEQTERSARLLYAALAASLGVELEWTPVSGSADDIVRGIIENWSEMLASAVHPRKDAAGADPA